MWQFMQSTHNPFRKPWFLLFLIPVGLFFVYFNQFIYPVGAQYSDLVISHLPNAIFLKSSLAAGKGIPFWSPTILSGYPFIANPLSGLFYPPGWLAALFPWAIGFNLLVALHLLWGGIGLFVYLRAAGLKLQGALAGGLMFEALPKLFAHFEAGHISLVYAVCWTPWLLWSEKTWGRPVPWSKDALIRLWRAPGMLLGLIFLIDSRWAVFAGVIWFCYTLSLNHRDQDLLDPQIKKQARFFPSNARWVEGLIHIGVQLILAACIAAPLAIPLLQYAHLSSRAGLLPDEAFTLSLPPARLLGIIFPDLQGSAEWTFYPGCFGLIFTILCLLSKKLRAGSSFWLWVLLVSLVYSLGSAIPGLKLIAYLPGFDLLRVPPRALFAAGLAFSILSARAVDGLVEYNPVELFSKRLNPNLFLAGIASFSLLFTVGLAALSGSVPFTFAWGAGCIVTAVIWVIMRLYGKIEPVPWLAGVIVLGLVNTGVVEFLSFSPRPPEQILYENGAVAAYLKSQPSQPFRVYSPSYSMPQQTAALAELQLADGIDPLQLEAYDRFMSAATGIPSNGYSVTLPPFLSGDPAKDNQANVPDPFKLGLLNVKYVLSSFDVKPFDGLVLEKQIGSTRIYVNKYVMPRAWVQMGEPLQMDRNSTQSTVKADITIDDPNEIEVHASGPGQLVLSEINYPGWSVWVDGKTGTLITTFNLLRSVMLPPGVHTVVFKFVPDGFYLGMGLFAVPWLIFLVIAQSPLKTRTG
jgi:hypothetical protein